jgi:hypothetical protein
MSNEHIISDLKTKKNDLIESFNKISINMITHLGLEFKDSIFCKNKSIIKNFFKFKPNEVIIMFLDNIYADDVYRKNIKDGNDNFFLTQSYEHMVNSGYESRIFEFKDIWGKMSTNTKLIVKDSMSMLVDHCELYLNILSQINKLK